MSNQASEHTYGIRAILRRGEHQIDDIELPDYGEVKIVTHAGKVTFVETSEKKRVE